MKVLVWILCCVGLFAGHSAHADTLLAKDGSFYPRLVKLAANKGANGHLIASFDRASGAEIHESVDQGKTWSHVGTIEVASDPWHCCSTLYEVPRKLAGGALKKGTLLWATSTINGNQHAIRLYRSTDRGRHWSFLATAATGSTGLWEPEFSIDAKGRLLMFYSSEEYQGAGYNQLIAHRVSTDGGVSWGADVFDVAVSDGKVKRPGMPVVRKLPDGRYVMSYEICGWDCDVYIRSSSDGSHWGDPAWMGVRVQSTSGNHFAHAPTVSWVADGSPNGRLLVIGQVLQRNSDNATVAGTNGRTYMFSTQGPDGPWTEAATPLHSPSDGSNPCTNYSSQLVGATDGRSVIQLANVGCAMYAGVAPLDNPVADGVYRLVSKNGGRVLDVAGCSAADGANVEQWDWLGGGCQRWKLHNLGNGDYTVTAQHSGQALDVADCSQVAGANVRQWPSNGADCQKWRIEPVGDGYYRLVTRHSGQVLDVAGCSRANGANVQQWTWLGGDCQRWALERVSANAVATGSYKIIARHSGQVLDVDACSLDDGGNVQQWPWNGAACQIWNVAPTADGFYELKSRHSGKALDLADGGLPNGTDVRQWTANGSPAQRWSIEDVGGGYVRLVNKGSLRVLDVAGCSLADGANVWQWDWLGGDCQRWQMVVP